MNRTYTIEYFDTITEEWDYWDEFYQVATFDEAMRKAAVIAERNYHKLQLRIRYSSIVVNIDYADADWIQFR